MKKKNHDKCTIFKTAKGFCFQIKFFRPLPNQKKTETNLFAVKDLQNPKDWETSRKQAEDAKRVFEAGLVNLGNEFTSLTTEQRLDALQAINILSRASINVSLVDIANYYSSHYSIQEITVGKALEEYIDERQLNETKTLKCYVKKIGFENIIKNITQQDIDKVVNSYTNKTTQKGIHKRLHGLFNWCITKRYCINNPVRKIKWAKIPKLPTIIPIPILQKALDNVKEENRLGIILKLGFGLRNPEIKAFKPEHIDEDDKRLIVFKTNSKDKADRRIFSFEEIFELLLKYKNQKIKKMPLMKTVNEVQNEMIKQNKIKKEDIPLYKHSLCSVWRHTYASYVCRRDLGLAVESLGHSSISMTKDHYANFSKGLKTSEFISLFAKW